MKITLIQSDIVWEDVRENLRLFSEKIISVIDKTDLIVLPEMFATGFSMQPEKFSKFSKLQIDWLLEQSKTKKTVITGSIIREENGKFFNSLIWITPTGNYQIYNKKHLFSFAGEHLHYTAGSETINPVIHQVRFRPLICYDLRFPVWCRNKNDYDVLLFVANWPDIRIDAWKTLLKARAIENLSYVVGVNRVGDDGNKISHSGNSCIFDYKGTEILSFEPFEEGIKTAEIDIDALKLFREKFPAEKDADDFMFKSL
jgi:predicted amidohydrolase